MASRVFELNQLGEEFVLRGLVARVHWILRPVKAFKSYWFQFDSWLQGIKLDNTLDILTLPTLMEGANACGSETASNEGLHFGTGVCHDYFAPNTYTAVKVDGATPKKWLCNGAMINQNTGVASSTFQVAQMCLKEKCVLDRVQKQRTKRGAARGMATLVPWIKETYSKRVQCFPSDYDSFPIQVI